MKKTTIMLTILIVIIVASASIYFLTNNEETTRGEEAEEGQLINDFDKINRVKVYANEDVSLEKEDNAWRIEGTDRPADQEKINHFVESMREMTGEESQVEAKEVNLDFPNVMVAFVNEEGENQQISVGQLNAQQDRYYIKQQEQDKIYLVDRAVIETIPLQKKELVDNKILSLSSETVEEIRINNGSEELLMRNAAPFSEEEARAHISGWYMHEPYHGIYSIAYSKMEAMLLGIDQLVPSETVMDEGDYGFADSNFSVTFSNDEAAETLIIGNPAADNHYYVRLEESEEVYTVSTDLLDPYSYQAFDMIDHFVEIVALEVVDELIIETPEEDTSIMMEHEQIADDEVATTVYKEDDALDMDAFRDVYKELAALSVDEEIEEDIHTTEAEVTIQYILGDITKEIQFIRMSDSQYAVSKGDNQPDFLIETEKVNQLIQKMQDL
ncbi:DUF4340 domain-containing protein [Gracilibacillus timonensis]|uniref:DUF4340 domain-containing protein n=1 Tax=Gracilibacillus timonensis TaxID=1816696 RepID=UPI0008256BDF|nr:DUF4340 domain-containing protein [Gracilibacillus timonensis]